MSSDKTFEELKSLVVHTLETNGVLGQIRAQLRANVYKAVENDDGSGSATAAATVGSPSRLMKSPMGRLMAEIVAEFFEFYGFRHSLSVLVPEASLGHERRSRADIAFDAGLPRVLTDASILDQLITIATGADVNKPEDWPPSSAGSTTASTPPPHSFPTSQAPAAGGGVSAARDRQRASSSAAASDEGSSVASRAGAGGAGASQAPEGRGGGGGASGAAESRRPGDGDREEDLDGDWKVLGKRLDYDVVPDDVREDLKRLQQMKQRSAAMKSSAADASKEKASSSPAASPAASPSAAAGRAPQSQQAAALLASPPDSPANVGEGRGRAFAPDDEESKSFSDSEGSGPLELTTTSRAGRNAAASRGTAPARGRVAQLSSTDHRPLPDELGEEEESVFEEEVEESSGDPISGFQSEHHSDNDSF